MFSKTMLGKTPQKLMSASLKNHHLKLKNANAVNSHKLPGYLLLTTVLSDIILFYTHTHTHRHTNPNTNTLSDSLVCHLKSIQPSTTDAYFQPQIFFLPIYRSLPSNTASMFLFILTSILQFNK